MNNKPIINIKNKYINVSIMYVQKCNFNDTYYLDDLIIDLDTLNKDELSWFDPFKKLSKKNDTLISIYEVSDNKIVYLEKRNDEIKTITKEFIGTHIICEDYNETLLLASHLNIYTKKSQD